MHNVTTCSNAGYVVTLHGVNCYIAVLQQCKFTFKFYYIHLISINVSNVNEDTISELVIYPAFNLSWIQNTNADFRFMISY
jgi:hypothetical protein